MSAVHCLRYFTLVSAFPHTFVQAQNKVLHYSISVSHQQLVCTTHFTDMGGDALNSLRFIFAFQNAFFTLT